MKCPKCGRTDHEPGAKFCHKCGTKLIEIDKSPIHIVEQPKPRPADAPGREAIDLGLPSGTKWASCNIGATRPEEYGGYYAWGETEEKSRYDWETYKYGSSRDNCQGIGKDIAGTQYDVAHVRWGGPWVMPSFDQIKELLANCSSEWTSLNGVDGRKFTGPNGNSIFLPAAGDRRSGGLYIVGSGGYYWSSTQNPSYSYSAYGIYFISGSVYPYSGHRLGGRSVRPVSR